MRKGVVSKDMATLGQQLLLNAANAGDGKTTAELLSLYALMETSAGQAVQAASILRKLAPDDQLYAAVRDVSERGEDHSKAVQGHRDHHRPGPDGGVRPADGPGRAGPGAGQDLSERGRPDPGQLEGQVERLAVPGHAGQPQDPCPQCGGQRVLPAPAGGQGPGGGGHRGRGLGGQRGRLERTKAFAASPELYRAAWADWDNVRGALSGNKYNDVKSEIESRRRISGSHRWRRRGRQTPGPWNSRDSIFKRITYADALAGYLQANGVTAEQMRAAQGQQKNRLRERGGSRRYVPI